MKAVGRERTRSEMPLALVDWSRFAAHARVINGLDLDRVPRILMTGFLLEHRDILIFIMPTKKQS